MRLSEVVIFPVGSFHLIRNLAVTSVLQCCFHTLFGSCRPTAGDRGTLKPHVPSWDLYSAVMHTEQCLYGASSGMLLLKYRTDIHRTADSRVNLSGGQPLVINTPALFTLLCVKCSRLANLDRKLSDDQSLSATNLQL